MKAQDRSTYEILICTYRRPDQLRRLLRSLADAKVPENMSCSILVIDNAPDRIHIPLDGMAFKLPVNVVNEPRLGICYARNRAITESRADWMVFLDDDQSVNDDFFQQLQNKTPSNLIDTAYAAVLRKNYTSIVEHPAKQIHKKIANISPPPSSRRDMGTGGFLFNRLFAKQFANELMFDPLFNSIGAEDTDLYLRAVKRGLTIHYFADFAVHEHIAPERLELNYQIASARRKGYADIIVDAKHGEGCSWWFRNLLKSLFVLGLVVCAKALPVTKDLRKFQNLSLLMARQKGKILALFGRPFAHYPESQRDTVILATQRLTLGGAEKVILDLALSDNHLRKILFLYNSNGSDSLDGECNQRGIICIRHQKARRYDPGIVLKLLVIIGYTRSSTFHSHDIGSLFYGRLLALLRPKIAIVHTVHTLHTVTPKQRYKVLMRFILDRSNTVTIAVSNFVRKELIDSFKLPPARIAVISNGIDIAKFKSEPKRNARVFTDPLDIVTVSRISPEKRLDIVLKGLAKAKQQGLKFRLNIVGSGTPEDEQGLQQLAAKLNISHQIIWHGFSTQIAQILAHMHLFISASAEECHPVSVIEAAASGLNGLLSDIAPHRDFLDYEGFKLFKDENELCTRLVEIDKASQRASIQFRCNRDMTPFDISSMNARYRKVYLSALNAPIHPCENNGTLLETSQTSKLKINPAL